MNKYRIDVYLENGMSVSQEITSEKDLESILTHFTEVIIDQKAIRLFDGKKGQVIPTKGIVCFDMTSIKDKVE